MTLEHLKVAARDLQEAEITIDEFLELATAYTANKQKELLEWVEQELPEPMTYKKDKGYDELDRGRYFGFNECLDEIRKQLKNKKESL